MQYDLLIRNGTVIDGSGLPRFRADVAIAHGKIALRGSHLMRRVHALEHLCGAGRGPGSGGPRSLFSRPVVLALLLWLGPSAGQADECRQLCDRDFWNSATPEDVKTLLATGLNVDARTEAGGTPPAFCGGVQYDPRSGHGVSSRGGGRQHPR